MDLLWRLSEVMVNYPLLKMKIDFKFPLIVPKKLTVFSKNILKKIQIKNFTDLIDEELKKKAEFVKTRKTRPK